MVDSTPSGGGEYFNAAYVKQAISMNNSVYEMKLDTAESDIWFHCDFAPIAAGNGVNWGLYTPAGDPVLEIHGTAALGLQLKQWNGSSYINRGTEHPLTILSPFNPQLDTIDIGVRLRDGSPSTIEMYVNDVLHFSVSTTTTFADYEVDTMKIPCSGVSGYVSQCMLADESTAGWRLAMLMNQQIGNFGPNNDWIGDPDFGRGSMLNNCCKDDEYDESELIFTGATAQREDTRTNYTFPATGPQTVAGVTAHCTAINDPGSAITDIAFTIEEGMTSILPTFGIAKTGAVDTQNVTAATDPATGASWSLAKLEDAFIGVISL